MKAGCLRRAGGRTGGEGDRPRGSPAGSVTSPIPRGALGQALTVRLTPSKTLVSGVLLLPRCTITFRTRAESGEQGVVSGWGSHPSKGHSLEKAQLRAISRQLAEQLRNQSMHGQQRDVMGRKQLALRGNHNLLGNWVKSLCDDILEIPVPCTTK